MTQPETYTRDSDGKEEYDSNQIYIHKKSGKEVMLTPELVNMKHSPDLPYGEYLFRMWHLKKTIEDNPMPEIRLGDWIGHVDEYGLWREGVICYMKENRIDFADKNQINICFLRNGIRTIRRAGQELWEAKK